MENPAAATTSSVPESSSRRKRPQRPLLLAGSSWTSSPSSPSSSSVSASTPNSNSSSSPSSSSPRHHSRRSVSSAVVLLVLGSSCFQLGVMVGLDVGQRRRCHYVVDNNAVRGAHDAAAATTTTSTTATSMVSADVSHLVAATASVVRRTILGGDDGVEGEERRRQPLLGNGDEGCVCDCRGNNGMTMASLKNETNERSPTREQRLGNRATRHEEERTADEDADSGGAEQLSSPDELRLVRGTGSNLAVGAAHVKRNEFFATSISDAGIPLDRTDDRKDDVLILYTSEASLPNASNGNNGSHSASPPAARAVENCRSLKVVFTEFDVDSNCIAIVGYPEEAYHVHRYHRVRNVVDDNGNDKVQIDPEAPLRPVPRRVQTRGEIDHSYLPNRDDTDRHMKDLVKYVGGLEDTLGRLRPIANAAARSSSDQNTVVAMAVNHGQSELLANFVCSARARNLDLSSVVVFATDPGAASVAQSLGVQVFDVRGAFGDIPAEAAGNYGDETFGKVVAAKIYCVHLLVWLGHNVLLQDVDVVWMRNPLEYFTPSRTRGVDLIFQEDGSQHLRFSPYFANTGFYYVNNNDRTSFFFSSLVRMGDVLSKLSCDQETITIFLNEHASWRGLKIQVLPRQTEGGTLFPSGYHYLTERDYMREFLTGKIEPYVFHMNWTPNKATKVKYLSQLGEWRVQPTCLNVTATASSVVDGTSAAVVAACCSAEPLLECHYRDLPSRKDCRHSPPLEGDNSPPFWPDSGANATEATGIVSPRGR